MTQPQAQIDPAQVAQLPYMTGAEFRVLRESLGLTTRWAADRLGVAERTVHRWESESQPVPRPVADELAVWASDAAAVIDRAAEALIDVPDPVLGVPRTGDMDGWPASWWRAIAAALQVEVPGLRVVYREDAQGV